ncbi:LysR substrate-binding domain-containing protein [Pseudomonas sp. 2(2015)]|uniref:LysR substrate-binding domain-containing protein n=1 Tax=Pseudomonas sp. 2(2015) TaxID=1619950 RepID=UPI0005EBA7C4|nr:LysR substrate-binding domain-containing protein [Pseudomonas sp. 2(2015)]KJK17087.1 LysR family transcriptional regulator [Pseudomonas sp. 2(2015)]
MNPRLNIDLLRTFHAVARFKRFKEAAAHVHRSASTVTTQIHKLEELVGQRLFARNNQGVELTMYGKKLLIETTAFLMSHDRLMASLTPQRMQGKIRLGLPDSYAAAFMRDLLPLLIADNPLLELEVDARSSGELFTMFTRKQVDLALVVSAHALEQGERLCETQPVWVVAQPFQPPAHSPLPLAVQLAGCPFRESAIRVLKEHGVYYRLILESASSPAVEACVSSGLAVGIIEESRMTDGLTRSIPGMTMPALPAHYLYLLSDSSNYLALHLHEQIRAGFRI